MNKLTICLLVLAAVYVDCASLKTTITTTFTYEQSMQRFIDIIKTYQVKFPESEFFQGLLILLSEPEVAEVPFFPFIVSLALFPGVQLLQTFIDKILEVFNYLNIVPEFDFSEVSHLTEFWQGDIVPILDSIAPIGQPLLDLIEAIDWTILVNFNAETANLSEIEKKFIADTLTSGFKRLISDLGKVTTPEELAAFNYVKYLESFNAILATQGINIGK